MTAKVCTNSTFEYKWSTFKVTYATANTETSTGIVLPKYAEVLWWSWGLFVQTLDAAITLDVGIGYATETGYDSNGFIAAISCATAGWVRPTLTATDASTANYISANTLGALHSTGVDGSNAAGGNGVTIMKNHMCDGTAKTISHKLLTGADTFVGYVQFAWFQRPDLTAFQKAASTTGGGWG